MEAFPSEVKRELRERDLRSHRGIALDSEAIHAQRSTNACLAGGAWRGDRGFPAVNLQPVFQRLEAAVPWARVSTNRSEGSVGISGQRTTGTRRFQSSALIRLRGHLPWVDAHPELTDPRTGLAS